jgi:hypothetical protein
MTLEVDRHEITLFVDTLFKHAVPQSFVSLRSFYDGGGDKPFRINPVRLTGDLAFLTKTAGEEAYRAANNPKKIVFCPPIATFRGKDRAAEVDIQQGLVLSVECDEQPRTARERLEQLLGPATVVVASGGTWIDPATGEKHAKLHLHWRLAAPAEGPRIADLKEARRLATRIAGADETNITPVHPLRWPGSWHRKSEPVLCMIDTLWDDREIDLDTVLTALRAAAPPEQPRPQGNGAAEQAGESWRPSRKDRRRI